MATISGGDKILRPVFQPITVTLESYDELDEFVEDLGRTNGMRLLDVWREAKLLRDSLRKLGHETDTERADHTVADSEAGQN